MSKNIAYMIYSSDLEISMLNICLASLRKYNPNCTIHLFVYDVDNTVIRSLTKRFSLVVSKIRKEFWINRVEGCKIERIKEINMSYGDRVLILDIDLIFKQNPFKIFQNDFDVFLTSRYYKHIYPVNGGVWGFKYNQNSHRFLDFFIDQLHNPTWKPLVEWRKKYNRSNTLNWNVAQDFLCVMFLQHQIQFNGRINVPWKEDKDILKVCHEVKLPFKIKIYDAGPKYNYAPAAIVGTYEERLKDVIKKINSNNVAIIHLLRPLHSKESLIKLGLIDN